MVLYNGTGRVCARASTTESPKRTRGLMRGGSIKRCRAVTMSKGDLSKGSLTHGVHAVVALQRVAHDDGARRCGCYQPIK